ncbi:MAG: hypothetical protein ACOY4K_01530 [Pseudomonadota bacterium]
MATVVSTPPALRWVALFLAGCAVLGLYLGFRDQIRRNPPGWYTGADPVGAPALTTADGIREAAPIDAEAARPFAQTPEGPAATRPAEAADEAEGPAVPPPTIDGPPVAPPPQIAQPARPPPPAPEAPTRPRPAAPAADPVGDILESQKAEPQVPY